MTSFMGFRRRYGGVGVRNIVAVISAMDNTNACANRITSIVADTVPITTPFGRTQIGHDFEMTLRTLAGIGAHPNVAAVLVLGLSLVSANALADRIRPSGKPVEVLGLQEEGGTMALTMAGVRVAADLTVAASEQMREPCDFSELVIAVECGGSDTTSGLASNPTVGLFADRFIDAGGTIILSEPAEFMGAEHILAERAVNPATPTGFARWCNGSKTKQSATALTCAARTRHRTTSPAALRHWRKSRSARSPRAVHGRRRSD